jgi:hypothetical protein
MKFYFTAFLSCGLALAQTMTIEEYEPKSTLVVPHPGSAPNTVHRCAQSPARRQRSASKLVAEMDVQSARHGEPSGGYGVIYKKQ